MNANKYILRNLQSIDYEHPIDKEALEALKKLPALNMVVRKANELGLDKILRLQSLANKIRVTERQFPELYHLFQGCREILDIRSSVDLFIVQAFSLNAFAAGIDYPHVTVTTELVNNLNEQELMFIFGHELGHLKSQHILYHQVGSFLPLILSLIGDATLGFGRLVGRGLEVAFYDWMRKSELTADRAGLLACQDEAVVYSTFSKLAGVPRQWFGQLNMAELTKQVEEFSQLTADHLNNFFQFFGQMLNTHPWVIIRLKEIDAWIKKGSYKKIIAKYSEDSKPEPTDEIKCTFCGAPREEGLNYCFYCGTYQE